MTKVSVSVIMAEYNTNTDDLKTAIKSILDQTHSDFEFIIVDDGGKNDLGVIKKELGNDKRIRIIKNPCNKGFVYSLNNAIAHANSEYLVRMDTDDISEKDRIKELYNYIKKHPEYSVVSSLAIEFSGSKIFGAIGSSGEKTKRGALSLLVVVGRVVLKRTGGMEVRLERRAGCRIGMGTLATPPQRPTRGSRCTFTFSAPGGRSHRARGKGRVAAAARGLCRHRKAQKEHRSTGENPFHTVHSKPPPYIKKSLHPLRGPIRPSWRASWRRPALRTSRRCSP